MLCSVVAVAVAVVVVVVVFVVVIAIVVAVAVVDFSPFGLSALDCHSRADLHAC